MQKAADITIAAYRHVAPRIERGMRPADIARVDEERARGAAARNTSSR